MSLITRMRRQVAVYFAKTGDDEYGKPTWAQPVEIMCRWEDVQKEFIKPDGTRALSQSVVYPSVVPKPGDVLVLGALVALTDVNDPKQNAGAGEVQQADSIPNLRATETLYIAYL